MSVIRAFVVVAFVLITVQAMAQGNLQSVENYRDAILGRQVFTPEQLIELDRAGGAGGAPDGKVDVADLVDFLQVIGPQSLVGEHVGIMVRDSGNLFSGSSNVLGQTSFNIRITNEFPLMGEIDNRPVDPEDPATALGHHSLYFPSLPEPLVVEFSDPIGGGFKFTVEFEVDSGNLKAAFTDDGTEGILSRVVTFEGDFDEIDSRLIVGTYRDELMGLVDGQGTALPVIIKGAFTLRLGPPDEEATNL